MSEPHSRPLHAEDLGPEPLAPFRAWLEEAAAAGIAFPETAVLATASADGTPSARAVLVKEADERGFVFYTNRESRKGRELDGNPRASLVFLWPLLGRQVRVDGGVSEIPEVEAAAYFATRPRASRIGAWASPQSAVIPGREELERRVAEVEVRFAGGDVPLPPFWGGYRVEPDTVEFWQHRASRLHDRIRFRRGDGGWIVERLAP